MHYFNKITFTFLLMAVLLLWTAQAATVTITNNTGGELIVNCASADDNIGLKVLQPNQSFNWSFTSSFNTLFYCDAIQDGIQKHFDAFYNGIRDDPSWSITRNGDSLEANLQ
jgi:hypothetical protein